MVHFVGAGCGAADLITVRGRLTIREADDYLCRIVSEPGASFGGT